MQGQELGKKTVAQKQKTPKNKPQKTKQTLNQNKPQITYRTQTTSTGVCAEEKPPSPEPLRTLILKQPATGATPPATDAQHYIFTETPDVNKM